MKMPRTKHLFIPRHDERCEMCGSRKDEPWHIEDYPPLARPVAPPPPPPKKPDPPIEVIVTKKEAQTLDELVQASVNQEKERRRYALLQAPSYFASGFDNGCSYEHAVDCAEGLLTEIEKRETPLE
jgi:hypothetical protein